MSAHRGDVLTMEAVRAYLCSIAGEQYADKHAATVLQELNENGYSLVSRHASLCGRAVFFGRDLREGDGKELMWASAPRCTGEGA